MGWPPSWPRCPALGSRTGTAPPPAGRTAGSWGGSSCTATQQHWSGWLSQHSALHPLLLPWASVSNIYREGEWTTVQCQLFLEREKDDNSRVYYIGSKQMLQILRDKNETVQCIAPFSPTQENAWNIHDLTWEHKKLTLPCMWVTKTWHTKPTLTSNLHASNKDLTRHTKPTLTCMWVTKTWLDFSHKTYTNLHVNNKDLIWHTKPTLPCMWVTMTWCTQNPH